MRIATIKLQLPVDPAVVLPTIQAYTQGFNHVCTVGWNDNDRNQRSLHAKTYPILKQTLPSQLAISARMKAVEALKSVKARLNQGLIATCPVSQQSAVRYDARSYSIKDNTVSIRLLEGRRKFQFQVPQYFKQYLDWQHTSADLFVRDGKVYLHVVMQTDAVEFQDNGEVVGIDRGCKKPAVLDTGKFFDGKHLNHKRTKYAKLRTRLNGVKTKSARRHLRTLKRKETRFVADVMHQVSKKIVSMFKAGTTFVLENLTHIRDRCKLGKKSRTMVHKWPFFKFQFFLQYKAAAVGSRVVFVDPAYTSKGCSRCEHIADGNRKSQSRFKCQKCGLELNADLNGSRNIRHKYLDDQWLLRRAENVLQPIALQS